MFIRIASFGSKRASLFVLAVALLGPSPLPRAPETLAELDAMVNGIRSIPPAAASSMPALDVLRFHVYQPSPWNGTGLRHGCAGPIRPFVERGWAARRLGNRTIATVRERTLGAVYALDPMQSLLANLSAKRGTKPMQPTMQQRCLATGDPSNDVGELT